jgi:hypothetical protein
LENGVILAARRSPLGSEFDTFLFAPIGEEQNGLTLRVVSLLARMNLDPWEEAGNLATLPVEAAGKRLASSLDSLTDPSLRQAICETMVLRLLTLLPRRAPAEIAAPVAGVDAAVAPELRTGISIIFIAATIVLLGVLIFAAQGFASNPSGFATAPSPPSQMPPPAASDH